MENTKVCRIRPDTKTQISNGRITWSQAVYSAWCERVATEDVPLSDDDRTSVDAVQDVLRVADQMGMRGHEHVQHDTMVLFSRPIP